MTRLLVLRDFDPVRLKLATALNYFAAAHDLLDRQHCEQRTAAGRKRVVIAPTWDKTA